MLFTCEDFIKAGLVPPEVCICDKIDPMGDHEIFKSHAGNTGSATAILCTPVRRYVLGDKYVIPQEIWEKLLEVRKNVNNG